MSLNSSTLAISIRMKKNKISKSKLGSPFSNTENMSEIKQKAFVPLLIKHRTFFLGHPVGDKSSVPDFRSRVFSDLTSCMGCSAESLRPAFLSFWVYAHKIIRSCHRPCQTQSVLVCLISMRNPVELSIPCAHITGCFKSDVILRYILEAVSI